MKSWTSSDSPGSGGARPAGAPAPPYDVRRALRAVGRHLWAGLQAIGRTSFADGWLSEEKEHRG
ncbi:hypothetical protein GCM10009850_041900 [Nonomuraea monospora]|uniref:Uncharacterized protein n=1 Tax=Nonomuraea monospora TaxID=568818 RepID=A0ABP5PAI4_9ACTN